MQIFKKAKIVTTKNQQKKKKKWGRGGDRRKQIYLQLPELEL